MRQTIRKFLHDTIAQIAGLNGSSVIWANQGAPKQAVPIVTLRTYAEQAESMADHRATDTVGEVDLRTPTAFVLELQYYGKRGSFPVDSVNDIVRALEKPTVVDAFMGAGVAFLYADPVQDLTDLLGNEQQYEPRAAVDLHCRYTSQVIDNVGVIDTVEIHGETPQDMDWTVNS
jgi:hypothetical protein